MRTPRIIASLALLAASLTIAGSTASAGAASAFPDWPSYHGNSYRSGDSTSAPTYTGGLHVVTKIALDGAVYASPIVAGGLTIVATENDTVYAFDTANRLVWKRHLGTPSPASQRPCGNIDPLGITGTPTYYSPTGLVYVAAEFSAAAPTHRLYGLSAKTGAMVISKSLDLPGVDQTAMQERGALALAGGRVWVPFGGLAGDCGAYKGRVVGYEAGGGGTAISYTVPTTREAGIWTPPGPTVDPEGNLFVSVGNGASGVGDAYDHSDSVLKISSSSATLQDSFSPSTWQTDNDSDLDLGSQGPAFVRGYVLAAGKSGTAYVLRRTHLGGIGGQVASKTNLCKSFGGTAVVGNSVFLPCTDGIRDVYIDPDGGIHLGWRNTAATGSPVYGGGVVWALDPGNGVLHGFDLHSGASRASVSVGTTSRFATPALSGRRILVGTLAGLTILGY